MSASDELPRGLFQTTGLVANSPVSLTYPAAPGVSWVLTAASIAAYQNQNVAASLYAQNLQATCNGVTTELAALAFNANPAAGDYGAGEAAWPGGPLIFPVGYAVVISASAGAIGFSQIIQADAYPI